MSSSLQRERLLKLFQQLADDAPLPATVTHQDSASRSIQRRDFNGWSIWFWYDGPVEEVRIVELERRRR